jgi:phosphoribosylformimino-5-aminoimidazole carboxamide ribotide isomerase
LSFQIYPAIDLRRGGAVRLRQGSASEEFRYSEDPVAVARAFREAGARALHVVDLDGAFGGSPQHLATVARIVRVSELPIRLGGGLRTDDDLEAAFSMGVAVVIVGTAAIEEPEKLRGWLDHYGSRLAVSLDTRDGLVRTRGWTAIAGPALEEAAAAVRRAGVCDLIVTAVARDGDLSGPDLALLDTAALAFGAPVIAAGGVASEADLETLAASPSVRGAIVGRAFYEGNMPLSVLRREW